MVHDQGCAHYWIIDEPDGPMSMGTCKHCGLGQFFKNSFDAVFDSFLRPSQRNVARGQMVAKSCGANT